MRSLEIQTTGGYKNRRTRSQAHIAYSGKAQKRKYARLTFLKGLINKHKKSYYRGPVLLPGVYQHRKFCMLSSSGNHTTRHDKLGNSL